MVLAAAQATATADRQNIGPLTTKFAMPNICSTATFTGNTVISDSAYVSASAYTQAQCESSDADPCFPHVTAYSDVKGIGYFYSPGTQCPSDWVTATTVTSGQGDSSSVFSGVRMDTLLPEETAAICCPSSFTYTTTDYNVDTGTTVKIGKCVRFVTTQDWYHKCGTDGMIPMTNGNFGKTTTASVLATSGTSSSWVTTNVPYGGMMVNAPTIQLNYRPADAGATSTGGESAATSGANSGDGSSSAIHGGAIAGIAIGVVVALAGIGAIIFFLWRRRRPHTRSAADGSAAEVAKRNSGGSGEMAEVSPLSAADTSTLRYEKPELAGNLGPRDLSTYSELDARQQHPVELAADDSHLATPVHYAEVDGQSAAQETISKG